MDPAILQTLIGAPPLIALIFYLVWDTGRREANRKAEVERRDAIDKDRLETDKALVAVLARIETRLGMQP